MNFPASRGEHSCRLFVKTKKPICRIKKGAAMTEVTAAPFLFYWEMIHLDSRGSAEFTS